MVDQAEIHRLVRSSSHVEERKKAVIELRRHFGALPNKQQAWNDLIHLINHGDDHFKDYWEDRLQRDAVKALSSVFPLVPNKKQAWNDLHQLTQDEDSDVRWGVAFVLGLVFSLIPDKNQAGDDLHRLAQDEDSYVRWGAAYAIGLVFPQIPNKDQAWADLIRLTKDDARWRDIIKLGSAFPIVPNKTRAWNDLHQLTQNKDSDVRRRAAFAIGSVFSLIPDKNQAGDDLHRLAQDEDDDVRAYANYSLGRASIFEATEAETKEIFKQILEKALKFFEKSSKSFLNLGHFCLPFYRSFYTITFKKYGAEKDVQKYLAEAKSAVKGSESKEKLLEAIENLSNALKEVQKARDFDKVKSNFNTYRRYCEHAADLLDTTEVKAPTATKLIRKGLPIINERIKQLINEINKNTQIFCDSAKGTEAEKFAKSICKEVKEIIRIRNPVELEKRVIGLIPNLSFMAENLPEREGNFVNTKVESIRKEEYLEDIFTHLNEIIVFVTPHLKLSKDREMLDKKLEEIINLITLGIREELVISVGAEFAGTGAKHEIHIPLQEITYPNIKKDLENIKGRNIFKLASLPAKLATKVRDFLIRNKEAELLKYLS